MGSDHEAPPPRPLVVVRLDTAVTELERVIDRFESIHRATADDLARTRAELTALRTLHETVSHRLDDAIARLKAVLSEEADGETDYERPDG